MKKTKYVDFSIVHTVHSFDFPSDLVLHHLNCTFMDNNLNKQITVQVLHEKSNLQYNYVFSKEFLRPQFIEIRPIVFGTSS